MFNRINAPAKIIRHSYSTWRTQNLSVFPSYKIPQDGNVIF